MRDKSTEDEEAEMAEAILGERRFNEGKVRQVYLGADGRQYVVDDRGVPVHGFWLDPDHAEPDAAVVVPTSVPQP